MAHMFNLTECDNIEFSGARLVEMGLSESHVVPLLEKTNHSMCLVFPPTVVRRTIPVVVWELIIVQAVVILCCIISIRGLSKVMELGVREKSKVLLKGASVNFLGKAHTFSWVVLFLIGLGQKPVFACLQATLGSTDQFPIKEGGTICLENGALKFTEVRSNYPLSYKYETGEWEGIKFNDLACGKGNCGTHEYCQSYGPLGKPVDGYVKSSARKYCDAHFTSSYMNEGCFLLWGCWIQSLAPTMDYNAVVYDMGDPVTTFDYESQGTVMDDFILALEQPAKVLAGVVVQKGGKLYNCKVYSEPGNPLPNQLGDDQLIDNVRYFIWAHLKRDVSSRLATGEVAWPESFIKRGLQSSCASLENQWEIVEKEGQKLLQPLIPMQYGFAQYIGKAKVKVSSNDTHCFNQKSILYGNEHYSANRVLLIKAESLGGLAHTIVKSPCLLEPIRISCNGKWNQLQSLPQVNDCKLDGSYQNQVTKFISMDSSTGSLQVTTTTSLTHVADLLVNLSPTMIAVVVGVTVLIFRR